MQLEDRPYSAAAHKRTLWHRAHACGYCACSPTKGGERKRGPGGSCIVAECFYLLRRLFALRCVPALDAALAEGGLAAPAVDLRLCSGQTPTHVKSGPEPPEEAVLA